MPPVAPPLIKAMNTVQSQSVTSVAAPMQAAALAALTGPQDCIATFREAFQRPRRGTLFAGMLEFTREYVLIQEAGRIHECERTRRCGIRADGCRSSRRPPAGPGAAYPASSRGRNSRRRGSGSFLVAAVDRVLGHLKRKDANRSWARELIESGCIVGVDIDPPKPVSWPGFGASMLPPMASPVIARRSDTRMASCRSGSVWPARSSGRRPAPGSTPRRQQMVATAPAARRGQMT
ncbi:hypothetical protein [Paracoccus mutanolyticus]